MSNKADKVKTNPSQNSNISNGNSANKTKKTAGRSVPSRYKANTSSLNTTPVAWNGTERKKFGTPTSQFTSTPTATKPKLFHDASAIDPVKPDLGQSLKIKPSLARKAPLVVKNNRRTEKTTANKKAPLLAVHSTAKSNSSGNFSSNNDAELILAYNQYLQACFLERMQEAAFISQDKHAQQTLANLGSLILDLQEKKKKLREKKHQLHYLKDLDDLTSDLAETLENVEKQLAEATSPYKELCETIDDTRNKLLVKNVVIDDTEIVNTLKEAKATLDHIHLFLQPYYNSFEYASRNFQEINKLIGKKSEAISDCENLLQLTDNLVIEEGSVAISSKYLQV